MTDGLAIRIMLILALAGVAGGQTTRLVPQQYPTIQGAIAAAVNGDSVVVAPGTYNETVNFLGKDLVVASSMGAAVTTIRGNFSSRVVTLGDTVPATAVLDGFTVEFGAGGILLDSNSATVKNCVVRNNTTTGNWGGAGMLIVCKPGFNASPQVQDCEFNGNFSPQAGGGLFIDLYQGGTPAATGFVQVDRCRFFGNQAVGTSTSTCTSGSAPPCPYSSGGGIAVRKQDPAGTLFVTVNDCEVAYNGSYRYGGGAYFNQADTVSINRCRIHHNTTGTLGGGGLAAIGGSVSISDCVIAKNVAADYAGGIYANASQSISTVFAIKNCTVVDNVGTNGAGIYLSTQVTGTLSNSIFWGNSLDDIKNYSSVVPTYCDFGPGPVGTSPSNVSVDPLFIDRPGGDYHLSRNSPLVDIGDPFVPTSSMSDTDLGPRLSGAQIDIGADEVPAAPLNGSGEDLEMQTYTVTSGDPNKMTLGLAPGDILFVRLHSAGGAFVGSNPLIVGQPFTTGFPPVSPPGLPGIHLDGFMLQVVFGVTANGFLSGASLPFEGVLLPYVVPTGLGGYSFRLQGFALSPFAANGTYAVTEAHDLNF